jgi:hypothetical protein
MTNDTEEGFQSELEKDQTLSNIEPEFKKPALRGFWVLNEKGEVATLGDARHLGSVSEINEKPVAICSVAGYEGYWILCETSKVYSFGDMVTYNLSTETYLNELSDLCAIYPNGYLAVNKNGEVKTFGSFEFIDSVIEKESQIVAVSACQNGYWILEKSGKVHSFGEAGFFGSGEKLSQDYYVDIIGAKDASGYLLFSSSGKVFNFGNTEFFGNYEKADRVLKRALVPEDMLGYFMLFEDGYIEPFGPATLFKFNSIGENKERWIDFAGYYRQ